MEDGAGGGGSGRWVLLLLTVPYFVGAWYNRTHRIEQSSLAGVTVNPEPDGVAHKLCLPTSCRGSRIPSEGGSVAVPTACRAQCMLLCVSSSTASMRAELARLSCGAGW